MPRRSRSRPGAPCGCWPISRPVRGSCAKLDLGGGFGIAYTSADSPSTPQALAAALRTIIDAECAALESPSRTCPSSRSSDQRPAAFMLYRGGDGQDRPAGRRSQPALRGGGRGHERQHPHRALRRGVLRDPRVPPFSAPPALARVVGKHCEGGDIVVRDEFLPADIAPGDLVAVPASGAYSRSMASNYNHVPRPAGRVGPGPRLPPSSAVRRSTICSRWTRMIPEGTAEFRRPRGWMRINSPWPPGGVTLTRMTRRR